MVIFLMTATKYAEGAFGMISGNPYEILEELREEQVYSSYRIVGLVRETANNFMVMYRTGGRKVLSYLLNWFTFDNLSDTTFNDVGGVTVPLNTATLVSGATANVTGVDGVLSGALWFSGISAAQGYNISGHVSLTAASSGMLGQTGTICAWIHRRASKANTIYEYGRQTGVIASDFFITFGIDDNDLIGFTYRGAVPLVISGTTATTQDTWTHVAVTSDGSKVKLYVNGILEPASVAGTNSGQWFGDMATSGTWARYIATSVHSGVFLNHFDGKIDNFRLAGFAMSESQLRQLYESKM